jgi:hypothetical protein
VVFLVKEIICQEIICHRRKFIFAIRLSFQGQNEDLDLKCSMEGRKLKNTITGRSHRLPGKYALPPPISTLCNKKGKSY